MKYIHWIFCLALLTSSFDIFLVLNLGGTVRFAQLLLAVLCVAGLVMMAQRNAVLWPTGMTALTVWLLAQALFLPLSGNIVIGIEFLLILILTIGGMLAVVQLYGRSKYLGKLMKFYLISFVVMAIFGLYQFLVPLLLHRNAFGVTQYWIYGRFARINGLSYEPSYYATYMILGWIALIDLRVSGAKLVEGRKWLWATALVTLALFLASSKTAWVCMLLEAALRFGVMAYRFCRLHISRLSRGDLRLRLPRWKGLVGVAALGAVVAGVVSLAPARMDWNVLLSGSGLNNTASHSVDLRLKAYEATKAAFLEHPWIGSSLGGVSSTIAARSGAVVVSQTEVRYYQGFPVFMEMLVASGVAGIIPLGIFLLQITVGELLPIKRSWPSEQAKWLRALVRAFVYEMISLTVDENILRVYLWFHITIMLIVSYRLKHSSQGTQAGAVWNEAALHRL